MDIHSISIHGPATALRLLDSKQTANALAIATSRALGYNAQFASD